MQRLLFAILTFYSLSAIGQDTFTLSGSITDASNGEEVFGATVYALEEDKGVFTNAYGFYSLTLASGQHSIKFSGAGYADSVIIIELNGDTRLDMKLGSVSRELNAVVITKERGNENITSTEMSMVKMDVKDIETIPVLLGEKDVVKTLQLMPGISSAGEGNTGFHVRGGSTDQNLILLDGAPIYNPSHLLGFFSVFNSDALKDLQIFKGGIPANYGGRASSVLDIHMKNGNDQRFGVSGGLGLVASRLAVEGPIVKGKGSFIVSGRRTYADLLLKKFGPSEFDQTTLYFWDLNAKANYRFGRNDRIFLSSYAGRDKFSMGDVGMDWGNYTATARWNHVYGKKLFSNMTFIYSNFDYAFGLANQGETVKVASGINDLSMKMDFDYFASPKHTLKIGGGTVFHTFDPGKLTSKIEGLNDVIMDSKYAFESWVYGSNQHDIHPRIKATYGLRVSAFNVVGPGDEYVFDEENDILDTISHSRGNHIKTYWGLEPRVAFSFITDENSSVKLSYNRMYQYLHLLSNSTSSLPSDIWMPSSKHIKPQIVDQVAVGYFRNFFNNKLETSVEGYYKHMANQTDFEDGTDLFLNPKIESQILNGTGWSYGAEFFVKKRTGKFTGWVSFTWSKTRYKFDQINAGNPYPAKQDRNYDVSVVLMYAINKKLAASATWVFQTGNAVTFPSGKYEVNGFTLPYYTERNGYRMPNYHRADVGLTWYMKNTERFEHSLNVSCYNVYNRHNSYSISFRESANRPNSTEAVSLALFGVVPSITYNFKIK